MNHWIFIANDNSKTPWDWLKDQKVGEIQQWRSISGNGNKKPHFAAVQKGDKIIGYSAGKRKSFVSLGNIEKPLENNIIEIRKTEDLKQPLNLKIAKNNAQLNKRLKFLNRTIIPLSFEEYNVLISLISDNTVRRDL
jgi:hypothetical protein